MVDVANESWSHALALYDSLQRPHWQHIRAFRDLVAELAQSVEAAGLTAVTSHATLIVSPYTCYPDWFDGRLVRLDPLFNGQVEISRHLDGLNRRPVESWTLSIVDARPRALALFLEL